MHKPHSPQRYINLFREAKKIKALVDLGSLHAAVLGSLNGPAEYTQGVVLTGEVFRFVRIDPDLPWFNTETSDTASEDDLSELKIPAHLLPNLQRIEFAFRPDKHQLWFVSHDRNDRMGPQALESFFQALFDRVYLVGKASEVEVTALPDAESLEHMLSIATLDKLTIQIKRPNADDFDKLEERILKKLESQNARRQETVLIAKSGETIKPDADTLALASVAAKNGSVSVVGKDASGMRVEESTQKRPMQISASVDSDVETSLDVLKRTMFMYNC